jgi:hypothetical protein
MAQAEGLGLDQTAAILCGLSQASSLRPSSTVAEGIDALRTSQVPQIADGIAAL